MTGAVDPRAYFGMLRAEQDLIKLRAECPHLRTQLVPFLNDDGWWSLCLDCGWKEEM